MVGKSSKDRVVPFPNGQTSWLINLGLITNHWEVITLGMWSSSPYTYNWWTWGPVWARGPFFRFQKQGCRLGTYQPQDGTYQAGSKDTFLRNKYIHYVSTVIIWGSLFSHHIYIYISTSHPLPTPFFARPFPSIFPTESSPVLWR